MPKLALLTALLASAPPAPDLDAVRANYGAGYYGDKPDDLATDLEALYPLVEVAPKGEDPEQCEARERCNEAHARACEIAAMVRDGKVLLDPPKPKAEAEGKGEPGGVGGGKPPAGGASSSGASSDGGSANPKQP